MGAYIETGPFPLTLTEIPTDDRIENKGIWAAPDYILDWMNQGLDRCKLTPREREVGVLMLQGLEDREIADILGNAISTIKHHTGTIYKKAGAKGRVSFFAKVFGL